jgi:hypothetical protein
MRINSYIEVAENHLPRRTVGARRGNITGG